jgi:hypothetical protein
MDCDKAYLPAREKKRGPDSVRGSFEYYLVFHFIARRWKIEDARNR